MEKVHLSKESFASNNHAAAASAPDQKLRNKPYPKNFVSYATVFHSDLYRINDFHCYHDSQYIFKPNYTAQFCINITRKGYFTFESYKKVEEEYTSRILVEKPGCEYKLIQQQPGDGRCSVFSFTDEGYEAIKERYPLKQTSLFTNDTVFSTMISSNPEADFIHHSILQQVSQNHVCRLQIDCLVAELVHIVIEILSGKKLLKEVPVNTKRFHLKTIERAKEYLLQNFNQDISLQDLAKHCFVSPFHFTRLFKQFCAYSPFTYLQHIRLKNAETLIRTTNLPVTDVCFRSGFSRLDYFSSTFAKQFGASPTKYKAMVA